jgi:hypothetical protein
MSIRAATCQLLFTVASNSSIGMVIDYQVLNR